MTFSLWVHQTGKVGLQGGGGCTHISFVTLTLCYVIASNVNEEFKNTNGTEDSSEESLNQNSMHFLEQEDIPEPVPPKKVSYFVL